MLGTRSPQRGLFEAEQFHLDLVGSDSFYGFLAQHRQELFAEEDFAMLYSLDNGRASVPPGGPSCKGSSPTPIACWRSPASI